MSSVELQLKIKGKEVKHGDIFEIVTEHDSDVADMCSLSLSNVDGANSASQVAQGDEVEVSASGKVVFKGEVTGIEPMFDLDYPSRVVIRALSKMHRLARGRKTRTFVKKTDTEIVKDVAGEAGLSLKCDKPTTIRHDHVYQHNQTNLEFIRQRAARIDYEILVEGDTLVFRPRGESQSSGVQLSLRKGEGTSLIRFKPRMSTANQVSKVTVRGWDPAKKKEIIGTAEASAQYGPRSGPDATGLGMPLETAEVERPIYKQEEADAIAKSILRERMMNFITGEAMCYGMPGVKLGDKIQIDVPDPRFKGTYYVAGLRHRYIHDTGQLGAIPHKETGYKTILKLQRDADNG